MKIAPRIWERGGRLAAFQKDAFLKRRDCWTALTAPGSVPSCSIPPYRRGRAMTALPVAFSKWETSKCCAHESSENGGEIWDTSWSRRRRHVPNAEGRRKATGFERNSKFRSNLPFFRIFQSQRTGLTQRRAQRVRACVRKSWATIVDTTAIHQLVNSSDFSIHHRTPSSRFVASNPSPSVLNTTFTNAFFPLSPSAFLVPVSKSLPSSLMNDQILSSNERRRMRLTDVA